MSAPLNDKVVVITGAAGRFGRAFVRSVAENGGFAIAADIDSEGANRVARDVSVAYPGRAIGLSLDITKLESIVSLIEAAVMNRGRIDAVVNNAYPRNSNYGRRLEDVTYEDFCENSSVHLGGYFLVMQQFALHFRGAGGGNIINMSSIYGVIAPKFAIYADASFTMPVEYAAIKAAIIHLTKYFAQYFKHDRVRVNSISPGGVFASQPPRFIEAYGSHCANGGMLDAEDICGALLYLLSDSSEHMSGQNLVIDDGFSL